MDQFSIATWNLLGDDFETTNRLETVSGELHDVDVCVLQEVITLNRGTENTASVLAGLTNMKLASLADGEVENHVSKKSQSTAILTRLPIVQSNLVIDIPTTTIETLGVDHKRYAGAILKSGSGRLVLVVSLHLPWGGEREHIRLAHIVSVSRTVDKFMRDLPKDSIAILAGDFNTVPQADTLRYLRGESGNANSGSFWVDAWDDTRDGIGDTFNPKDGNLNIARTAKLSGIQNFNFMPSRRIDYIFVRGWSYGRPGSPLRSELIGVNPGKSGLHASDHYGIKAKIWDPA